MAVPPGTQRVVRERVNRRCEYCHADERWQFVRFTMDHVLPQSAGGSDDADNLALACRNCNERRGNRLEGRDPETAEVVPLFNPRRDRWADHFVWDIARLRIVGRTSTGRATAELLDLKMTAMIAPSYAFDSAICQMDTIRPRKTLCFLYRPLDQALGLYTGRRAGHGYSCTTPHDGKEITCV